MEQRGKIQTPILTILKKPVPLTKEPTTKVLPKEDLLVKSACSYVKRKRRACKKNNIRMALKSKMDYIMKAIKMVIIMKAIKITMLTKITMIKKTIIIKTVFMRIMMEVTQVMVAKEA